MYTRTITTAAALAIAGLALTACSSSSNDTADSKPSTTPSSAAPTAEPSVDMSAAEKAAGIPPEPTGAKRQELLDALRKVNPGIVKYEDKAVDAARNQCASINGGGQKLDWSASQRFTYKDVTTTEAQGRQINEALRSIGFCKV